MDVITEKSAGFLDLHDSVVCVVGAGGFIGRAVVDVLAESGAKVVAFARRPVETSSPVRMVIGEAQDRDALAEGFAGCDTVVYLANVNVPGTANDDMASEIAAGLMAPIKAAQLAATLGVKRFIFPSSGGTVYGNQMTMPIPETALLAPLNAYGVSKLAAEHYLRILAEMRKISVCVLRVSNPYGEHQDSSRSQGFIGAAIRAALSGSTLRIFGGLETIRDFVYVRDVAEAIALACQDHGFWNILNVGSGVGSSLGQIVDMVQAITGEPIALEFTERRPVDVSVNILNVTRAAQTLGWKPQTDLSEGLRVTADWWRTKNKKSTSIIH
jgi:UDP-glucose 4-epimerase